MIPTFPSTNLCLKIKNNTDVQSLKEKRQNVFFLTKNSKNRLEIITTAFAHLSSDVAMETFTFQGQQKLLL